MYFAYCGDTRLNSPSVAQHHSTYASNKRQHILINASENTLTQVSMPRHTHRPIHALNWRYQSIELI